MIALGITLLVIIFLLTAFVGGMRYQQWLGQRHADRPVTVVTVFPETEALALRAEQVRTRDAIIHTLSSLEIVPVSPWLELPWQRVPSPARTFWAQGLVDEIQDLRVELAQTREQLVHMDWVRARHWTALKRLRAKAALMVPAVVADVNADNFTRSLTVAKSAFGRAADLSTAITELDVARAESQSLEEFNTEFEQILERHQIGVLL